MAERLDFSALWPVPAGRFGWTARGNAPCVMEIVCWLTAGTIDTAWPGVSPAIAEYVEAAQDAVDDEPRQKLLVLVPGLIGCVGKVIRPKLNPQDGFCSLKDRCCSWCPWSSRASDGRKRPRPCAHPAVLLRGFDALCGRPRNMPRRTLS